MDIYLIRHGECYNSTIEYFDMDKRIMNPPLTEKGIEQAEKLGARCKSLNFDMVISSDLIRSIQTAEKIISDNSFSVNPAFREIDMGDIHTKSWNYFPQVYAEWLLHNEDIPYPNGENGEAVWKRCKIQLDKIIDSQHKNVAIVCHGGTIRSIVCGILEIPQQRRFYFGFPPVNCSITIIKHNEEDKRFYLHTFNDFSHLSE